MKHCEEKKKMAYVTTAERLGIKKGFSQGLEQGIEQGVQQGMEKKALEIAANMKQAGIDAAIADSLRGWKQLEESGLCGIEMQVKPESFMKEKGDIRNAICFNVFRNYYQNVL